MTLDQNTLRRFAFIKYLFRVAVTQSTAPEPFSAASILTFHDAIEFFLELASEHLDVGGSQPKFMEYWDRLSDKLPQELGHKAAIRRLNNARVALKHHGTLPSGLDIEAFRVSATNFFEDNTPLLFGVSFSEISTSDYVQPDSARSNLMEAEKLIRENKVRDALDKTAIAFEQMLDDYEERKRDRFGRSPFFFGRDLTFYDSFSMGLSRVQSSALLLARQDFEPKLAEFIDRVHESLISMQSAIKMLALGVDYRRFSKFKLLTPHVNRNIQGDYLISRGRGQPEPSNEDANFCIDFVVETAVRLNEFDYSVSTE